ncbi:MAG TPA: sigma-70 family RNA polymerase sigma factor [Candidatus Acidoferrum sp.]|nr:sigma-70 family RNA polymerase sigma factor [Candidatus Acidoferrum sp.]
MRSKSDGWVVLNPEVEQELAWLKTATTRPDRSIDKEALGYIAEVNAIPRLTASEELELAKKIARGDRDAFARLIRGSLYFVVAVSRNYFDNLLPLLDRIQAGNTGLVTAANEYDYRKGVPFQRYAKQFIDWEIIDAIYKEMRLIYLSKDVLTKTRDIWDQTEALAQRLGHFPTVFEIAEVAEMPRSEIQLLLAIYEPLISLDSLIAEEEFDMPDGSGEDAAYTETLFAELHKVLWASLGQLAPRERMVLDLRFGLTDGKELTLEDTGKRITPKVTRERVRQIEAMALRKLRHPAYGRRLREYL